MIRSKGDEELEKWLNRATDPSQPEENSDAILRFTQQVTKDLEGPQIALKLLAHKIQSPMEREALYALSVTESCVRFCGSVFHQELGKFRFLNEVIKVISPKYLGGNSSETVRKRCIELMYSWSKGLYTEPKIKEAYDVLKKQGLVVQDPTYIDQALTRNPYLTSKHSTEPSIFHDEKTSEELNKLLKSKRPEDLIKANSLIKGIVKKDSERMEKLSQKLSEMETIRNNIQLLGEMLNHYQPSVTANNDLEIIQVLYKTVESARLKLFKFASETDDKNDSESLNEILKLNDDAGEILRRSKDLVGFDKLNTDSLTPSSGTTEPAAPSVNPRHTTTTTNVSLIGEMEDDPFDPLRRLGTIETDDNNASSHTNLDSLLDTPLSNELLSPQPHQVVSNATSSGDANVKHLPATSTFNQKEVKSLAANKNKVSSGTALESGKSGTSSTAFQDLDFLGKQMLEQAKVSKSAPTFAATNSAVSVQKDSAADSVLLDLNLPPVTSDQSSAPIEETKSEENTLSSIPSLTLSSLKPHSEYSPQPILQSNPNSTDPKSGLVVTLHFTTNRPLPDVTVLLCVVSSTLSQVCENVQLTATCRKNPDSLFQQNSIGGSAISASSPFIPSTPLSWCILVREPEGKNLTFTLSYTHNGSDHRAKSLGITLPEDLLDSENM